MGDGTRDVAIDRERREGGDDANGKDEPGAPATRVALRAPVEERHERESEHQQAGGDDKRAQAKPVLERVDPEEVPGRFRDLDSLYARGADPDRTDNSGRSARDYAKLDPKSESLLAEIKASARAKSKATNGKQVFGPK